MVRQYVLKGFNGQQRSGDVLMCWSCAGVPGAGPSDAPTIGPADGSTGRDLKKLVAVVAFVGMAVVALIVVAVGDY